MNEQLPKDSLLSLLKEAQDVVFDCLDAHTQTPARGEYLAALVERMEAVIDREESQS